jgi:hypothetical protein
VTELAYELREPYREDYEPHEGGPEHTPFAGASAAYGPNGETLDVAELLEAGGGMVRTADGRLQALLDDSPAFRRTSAAQARDAGVPELARGPDGGALLAEPAEVDLVTKDSGTRDELAALAEAEDVGVADGDTKQEIADAINEARRASAGEGEE